MTVRRTTVLRTANSPASIKEVLTRWQSVELLNYKDEPEEGLFTNLTMKEEFRCLIGALYGRGYANGKSIDFGSPDSPDVALRCAYYANANLKAKDMKAFYEKDKGVYVFAALYNSAIYTSSSLRKLFEEEHLTSDLARKYRKHAELVKKRFPRSPTLMGRWLMERTSHSGSE